MWEVAVFVPNVLAFILVGFQLKSIAARMTGSAGAQYVAVAAAETTALVRLSYELRLRRAEEEFAGDGADVDCHANEVPATTPQTLEKHERDSVTRG